MTRKTIFPVTRIHEPLRVDVEISGGRVTDAWVGGHLFRGWEPMMSGRDVRDAALFTQRICGICSSAHAVASTMALQQATGLAPTPNGQHLTNLILAADVIQNHLRHFYLLTLYDYVDGPLFPPWLPRPPVDLRLPKKINDAIVKNAITAVRIAAIAHELMALLGAKAPHQQTIVVTGVTEQATADNIKACLGIIREIKYFVEGVYVPDAQTLGDYYKEYYTIGSSAGNLLSYGMFPAPVTGRRAFGAGVAIGRGAAEPVDGTAITEEVRHSWYREGSGGTPFAEDTLPDKDKPGAYSWMKSPRYKGVACEGGPVARAWLNGYYRRGTATMDRIVTRALETQIIVGLAEEWLSQLVPGASSLRPYTLPPRGQGVGLTDVMRGALGHWIKYQDGRIQHYQIITPTTWKFSPRDDSGQRGPVEEALIGTPVADADSLIEVGRVVRSFDPCLTCAIHVINAPGTKPINV